MRVICDKCGSSYKISDDRLTREVNKATCRKCGEPIYVRRPSAEPVRAEAPRPAGEEDTKITSAADLERQARARASQQEEEGGSDVTVPRSDGPPPMDPTRSGIAHPPLPEPEPPTLFTPVAPPAPFARPPVASLGKPPPPVAAPMVSPTLTKPPGRTASPLVSSAAGVPHAPAVSAAMPSPTIIPPQAPAPVAPAPVVSAPVVSAPVAPAPVAPAPIVNPPRPAPVAPAPVAPAPVAPVAAPAAPARARAAAYDPRSDLTVAMGGVLVALFGILILAINGVIQNLLVGSTGVFFGCFGAFTALLVLFTGDRGTRPASGLGSVIGSMAMAVVSAGVIGTAGWLQGPTSPEQVALVPDPLVTSTPEPAPTPAPATLEPAPATPVAAKTAEPTPKATPAPAPTPAPTPVPTPKATPTPAPTPTPTPKATATPAPTPKATATPAPAAETPAFNLQVVRMQITSNKRVKQCFFDARDPETKAVPPGVKVRISIAPSGKATAADLVGGATGGGFDSCLKSAILGITYAPFTGTAQTFTLQFS